MLYSVSREGAARGIINYLLIIRMGFGKKINYNKMFTIEKAYKALRLNIIE